MGEMQPKSDTQLLREYADRGAEVAFAEIIARHTNLVYSAALRQVASPDVAAEVAQEVFVGLARCALSLSGKMSENASLAGWLCRSARNISLNHRRDEFRRHSRERQAMQTLDSNPDTPPDWEQLRPLLDEAMSELSEPDYDALVLRYFKNQDLRSVGVALGVSDGAAQKRVSRAVERLRELVTKRGITVGASGLAAVISANAVQATPVGLAVTISTAAGLAGTTIAATTATTAAGLSETAIATTATATATKAIAMTALQKTIVTATVFALAGAGIYGIRHASQLREQVQALQQQHAPLTDQIAQMNQALTDTTNLIARLRDENERLTRNAGELLKLRSEVGSLRIQATELARLNQESRQGENTGGQRSPDQKPVSVASTDFPRELWVFSGFSTPEAALQSWAWGMSRGDAQTVLNSLTAEAGKEMVGFLAGQNADQPIAADIINNIGTIPGYKITDNRAVSESERLVAMLITPSNPSDMMKGMTLLLKKVGNDWKIAGPVKEE